MIQEIESEEKSQRKYEKKENLFGKNLRKAFKSDVSEKKDRDVNDIKIRLEETWLTEIKTMKLK